jgi:hypothetical protein
MPTPYMGRNSTLGLAEESTWGTPVARATWCRLRSSDLAKKTTRAAVPDLGDNGTSLVASQNFIVSENTAGNAEFNVSYDEKTFTTLLKHAMGAVVDAGSGPYTHTYTLLTTLPVGLTVEIVKGTGHGEVFEGCKVNKLTLSVAAGEVMRGSVEFLCETSGGPVAAATPTLIAAPILMLHNQSSTISINSVTYTIKSWEQVIDNKLIDRPQLGATNTLEPQHGDKVDVTWRVVLERVSDALEALEHSGTQADATITFTSGAAVAAFTLHNAQVMEYSCPPTRVGPLEETVLLRGFRSATKTGLGIVITNANATAV